MGLRPSPAQSMVVISSTLAPLNKRLCKILPGRCFFYIFLFDAVGRCRYSFKNVISYLIIDTNENHFFFIS